MREGWEGRQLSGSDRVEMPDAAGAGEGGGQGFLTTAATAGTPLLGSFERKAKLMKTSEVTPRRACQDSSTKLCRRIYILIYFFFKHLYWSL